MARYFLGFFDCLSGLVLESVLGVKTKELDYEPISRVESDSRFFHNLTSNEKGS